VIAEAMTAYYERHPADKAGFGRDLEEFAAERVSQRQMLEDPWGNLLVGEGALTESGYSYISLRSAGADGKEKTDDDIVVQVVAQRQQSSVVTAPFKGTVSVRPGLFANRRIGIEGFVKDTGGHPVSKASVRVQRMSNGRVSWAYTDVNGEFSLNNLSPGSY